MEVTLDVSSKGEKWIEENLRGKNNRRVEKIT
jgi:hypothetical protein